MPRMSTTAPIVTANSAALLDAEKLGHARQPPGAGGPEHGERTEQGQHDARRQDEQARAGRDALAAHHADDVEPAQAPGGREGRDQRAPQRAQRDACQQSPADVEGHGRAEVGVAAEQSQERPG